MTQPIDSVSGSGVHNDGGGKLRGNTGMRGDVLATIQPTMQAYAEQHGITGIATLLAWRGGVVHAATAGWQDVEKATLLTQDSIYRIYSMTKPIVCAAFLMLCETGKIGLDEPLAKYLPAFGGLQVLGKEARLAPLSRPILIRDLLTHTAGLTYDFLEDNPVSALYRDARLMADSGRTLTGLIHELTRLPLAFQPGTHWHYSLSIDVIAHLIEVISGWPLEDYLIGRLFKPLGMNDTRFSVSPDKQHRLAAMMGCPDVATSTMSEILAAQEADDYCARDVESSYPSHQRSSFARGGHGLFSTLDNFYRFAQMLLNEGELDGTRVLSRQAVRLMCASHVSANFLPFSIGSAAHTGYGYGLGVRVRLNAGICAYPGANSEFGWEGAARTSFWVDPENELVGVLMMQHMVGRDWPEREFRELAYRALSK